MEWDELARRLGAAFNTPKRQLRAGTIWTSTTPFDLESAFADLASDEDRELSEFEGVRELVSQVWRIRSLVTFTWDSFGPMSWTMSIELLDVHEARPFVCLLTDEQPWTAFAALEPKTEGELFPVLLEELIPSNGQAYGVSLFGSIPSFTHNSAPELLPADVLRRGYRAWLDASDTGWADFADDLLGRFRQPDHLERSLEALRDLPNTPEGLAAWLAHREQSGKELSAETKTQLLDVYFATFYREMRA